MLVLITYDVNTETAEGKTRLRKVAKQCVNYGRRVQNSVFECILDNAQCVMLKAILTDLIDKDVDSLRFYYLGNRYQTKIEHVGVDRGPSGFSGFGDTTVGKLPSMTICSGTHKRCLMPRRVSASGTSLWPQPWKGV